MIKWLLKAYARWNLKQWESELYYWQRAEQEAREKQLVCHRRINRLEQAPNEIDYPLPNVFRKRTGI